MPPDPLIERLGYVDYLAAATDQLFRDQALHAQESGLLFGRTVFVNWVARALPKDAYPCLAALTKNALTRTENVRAYAHAAIQAAGGLTLMQVTLTGATSARAFALADLAASWEHLTDEEVAAITAVTTRALRRRPALEVRVVRAMANAYDAAPLRGVTLGTDGEER